MKKLLLTLALGAGLYAGGGISVVDPIYTTQDQRSKLYAGVALNAGETYSRGSQVNFTGYSEGEYTNMGLTGIFGYDALKFERSNIFVEARLGTSLWMEDSEEMTTAAASILLKPVYNFTDQFGLYGLIGGSYVDWTDNVDGWFNHSSAAFAIGLGAQLRVNENVYVFADYLLNATDTYSEFFDDNVNFDLTTVGLLYRF